MRSAGADKVSLNPAAGFVRVVGGIDDRRVIEVIDTVDGCFDRINVDFDSHLHRHSDRINIDTEPAPVTMHLQDPHHVVKKFGRNCADVEVLVVVAQRLTVEVNMNQAAFGERPAVGIRQVLISH